MSEEIIFDGKAQSAEAWRAIAMAYRAVAINRCDGDIDGTPIEAIVDGEARWRLRRHLGKKHRLPKKKKGTP